MINFSLLISRRCNFLEKNLEFIIEEEKLQEVLKILNEEILKYIEKRKTCNQIIY